VLSGKVSTEMNLQDIFDQQIKLNERIVPDLYVVIQDTEVRRTWFLKYYIALQQELAELVDSFAWKFWKAGNDNVQNAKVELVDILHFWVSMCTVLGMDANEVFELYAKKNKLNHERQSGGYKDGTYQKVVDGVEDNERLCHE
jgi:dimeric dUTPase (all-alpha-NTP-PPase superfamily)